MRPIVYMLQRLRQIFGKEGERLRRFALEAPLLLAVEKIARKEERSLQAIATELVELGLTQRELLSEANQRWFGLTPREQQVVLLACQGYANRQIAYELKITEDTVKSHMHNALEKNRAHDRDELRAMLEGVAALKQQVTPWNAPPNP
jgi:DNA-binding NarL/FixJ family response regulator